MKKTNLFVVSDFALFVNEEVDVDVGMNEIAISRPSNDSLDPHKAVLLESVEDSRRLERFLSDLNKGQDFLARLKSTSFMISFYPANVFAASETPLLETLSPVVETSCRTTPEKHKTSRC